MAENTLTTTQPIGSQYTLTTNQGGNLGIEVSPPALVVTAPFRGLFYIDPTFAGTEAGSQSNPFVSAAHAFAAAAALALAGAVLVFPEATTVTENITFPALGDWQLYCSRRSATLAGTVTMPNAGGAAQYVITNLIVTGAVTGTTDGAATVQFILEGARFNSTITLSSTAGSTWNMILRGPGQGGVNGLTGTILGAVVVAGLIAGSYYNFFSTITFGANSVLDQCSVRTAITSSAASLSLTMTNTIFALATTITGAVGTALVLRMDGYTQANAFASGLTLANVTPTTRNANASSATTLNGNQGTVGLISLAVDGVYEALATLDLIVAGTAGTAVQNIIYTNRAGGAVTQALHAGLLVTAALGTEASGQFVFSPLPGTAISYSVTGVVTPGALVMFNRVAVRKCD